MIAFVGSVFSPYYHWAGRREPDNHIAFNVALYQPSGDLWTMTERGRAHLSRSADGLSIGPSRMRFDGTSLRIDFDETALPWPGQRLWPKRVAGSITLRPSFLTADSVDLDPAGRHRWWPVAPLARVSVECDAFPGGGWEGQAYHDINSGDRPIETDFLGWDWARGHGGGDSAGADRTVVLYDSLMRDGARRTLGLGFDANGAVTPFTPPGRQVLPAGFWGVRGGVSCDDGATPTVKRKLEDTPFYTRSLIRTTIAGDAVDLVHETLDCRRLANPLVRMMLPFRMPRRA